MTSRGARAAAIAIFGALVGACGDDDGPEPARDAGAFDAATDSGRVGLDAARDDAATVTDGGLGVDSAVPPDAAPEPAFVLPEDIVLVPPVTDGPILATITGYEMTTPCPFAESHCERPLYASYDRDMPEWWDVLVEELLTSRVNVVLAHGRGCYDPDTGTDGNGNMCPRLLSRLVDAIDRAGARSVIRLAMWDDTGAYQGARNTVDGLPADTRFDLADPTSWRFFWDHNMKIWFDTIPSELWFRLDGRPVVAFWTLSSFFFQNQSGNASALLRDLRAQFMARYGEDPLFVVDTTWVSEDATIGTSEAQGVHDWFGPPDGWYTYRDWGGAQWGAAVPGFRDPDNAPGCGVACREVPRRDGDALREALAAGSGARFVMLEGWTDVAESAGYYRSEAWRYPSQYLNVVREHADPRVPTLRLQAEAADRYFDRSAGNVGSSPYRAGGDLDTGRLTDATGWFVGWTEPGEWIEHAEAHLACGTYRFTARVAANAEQTVHLEIDGHSLGAVTVPATADFDTYELVHLGAAPLAAGPHDLRLVTDTGATNLDYLFLRRSTPCP